MTEDQNLAFAANHIATAIMSLHAAGFDAVALIDPDKKMEDFFPYLKDAGVALEYILISQPQSSEEAVEIATMLAGHNVPMIFLRPIAPPEEVFA